MGAADEKREALLAAGTGLVVVLLWAPLWSGARAPFIQDVAAYFWPMKAFLAATVKAGHWPWWNPWLRNGLPFYANPEAGLFYPLDVLFYVLPTALAFDWSVVLHFALAAAGFHLWLRRSGRSAAAATFGALGIALGGFAVSAANYPNMLQALAWTGWTLWAWAGWLERRRARDLALVAAGFALQFLGGEPQVAVLTAVVALGIGWVRPDGEAPAVGVSAPLALGAAAVGAAALAAVQLVPTAELFRLSARHGGLPLEEVLTWSLRPLQATSLVLPRYFDGPGGEFSFHRILTEGHPWVFTPYLGVPVVAFAAAAAGRDRARAALWWGGLAAAGLFLAMGRFDPVARWLFSAPLGLRFFRYPEKLLLLPAVAAPALAAVGLDLARENDTAARRALWAAAGVVAVGVAVRVWLDPDRVRGIASAWEQATPAATEPRWVTEAATRAALHVALAGAALGALLAARRRIRGPVLAAAVLAVTVADLATVNLAAAPLAPASLYASEPDALAPLPRHELETRYRIRTTPIGKGAGSWFVAEGATPEAQQRFLVRTMGPNLAMLEGVLAQDGSEAFRPVHDDWKSEIMGQLPVPMQVRYLRLMSAKYLLERPATMAGVAGVERGPSPVAGLALYRIVDPLPRAYLVRRAVVQPDSIAALNRLIAGGEDPHLVAYVDRGPGLDGPSERARGEVRWLAGSNHSVRLEVATPDPALLVLTDTAYPGWRATVDGRPVPVVRANWHFRGLLLEAGEHRVRFDYRPRGIVPAGMVSGLALAGLAALLAFGGGRRGA